MAGNDAGGRLYGSLGCVGFVAIRRAVHLLHHVEAIAVVGGAENEFGDTDVVMACTESDRLLALNASTYHTAREVDERLVDELHVLYLAVERNLHAGSVRVGWVASGGCKHMAVLLHLDEVVADGHADGECAVLGRLYEFAVATAYRAIYIERASLHGIIGAFVEDGARYGERRYVGEVYSAMHERRGADVACGIGGRELVYAQGGDDHIVGAFARERYATDDEVALCVGQGKQSELLRCGDDAARGQCAGAEACVVAVCHATRLRVVVGGGLSAETFVDGPVGHEGVFRPAEGMVVVGENFLTAQCLVAEHAHLVDVAREGTVGRRLVAAAETQSGVVGIGKLHLGVELVGKWHNGNRIVSVDCRHGGCARCINGEGERREGVGLQIDARRRRSGCALHGEQIALAVGIGRIKRQLQLAAEVENGGCGARLRIVGANHHLQGVGLGGEILVERLAVLAKEHAIASSRHAEGIELSALLLCAVATYQCHAGACHGCSGAVGDAARHDAGGATESVVALLKACIAAVARGDAHHLVVVILSGQRRLVLIVIRRGGAAGLVDGRPCVGALHTACHLVACHVGSYLVGFPCHLHQSVVVALGGVDRRNLRVAGDAALQNVGA